MSMRNFVRLGSSLSIHGDTLRINSAELKQSVSGSETRLIIKPDGSNKSVTFSYDSGGTAGGKLHGTWTSENSVTTSDRRLKRDIVPLHRELLKLSRGSAVVTTTQQDDSLSTALVHQKDLSDKLTQTQADAREQQIFDQLSKKEQDGEALLTLFRELR